MSSAAMIRRDGDRADGNGVGLIAAVARRLVWRVALSVTGGLRVAGGLPDEPCVLVANHSSHADTVALLASLPARRRPVVAAAADYWFGGALRRLTCRALVGAFPVRRTGGGSGDLAAAAELLAAGHDVIVFPEGSRSRDGCVGEFHSGALRLAASTGAPMVPIGIAGTRDLLPVHGRLRRSPVTVHIGAPVVDLPAARAAVVELATRPRRHVAVGSRPDSLVRGRVAAFADSRAGLVTVAGWAFGEAVAWPLLPEFALVVLGLAAPRRVLRLAFVAAAASVVGGAAMYALAANGVTVPSPLTTPLMHRTAAAQVATQASAALHAQPMSGIPYKVYAAAAGRAHTGVGSFVADSLPSRGLRIVVIGALAGAAGLVLARRPRYYPAVVALFVTVFCAGLAAVVQSWS
jgi:1-acyl-sn-glycerol-3-phosphate acyltransferase